ncbi:hypothetical protein BDP27DRAFT_1483377 [Rhodocollybia butyracea]|uniref:Uncharacterized protein n=1 Tax=Rhodocollybia butyracea TaxID=206335 RepID=A0A9P5PGN4_9AGAR|nr:hypothetical protein BDP27DRAFT_1483377 [Rhodocollybia butyracea]
MSSEVEVTVNQQILNNLIIPITIEAFLYGKVESMPCWVPSHLNWNTTRHFRGSLQFEFIHLSKKSYARDAISRSGIFFANSTQQSVNLLKIQSDPYYIFAITGMLSDAMMIHRCYCLWNSRKSVIILPLFGLIGICITWIVVEVLAKINLSREVGPHPEIAVATALKTTNTTAMFTSRMYGCATLAENIILTGLMAGRVWWLERRIKNILITGERKTQVSQSLLGPILQSGALNPIFLSIYVGAAYSPALSSMRFLTPCALTQIFGISSTLIVLSIGIGLASDSQSRMFVEETQSKSEEADPSTRLSSTQDGVGVGGPRTETIQPLVLKYDRDAITEPLRESTNGSK